MEILHLPGHEPLAVFTLPLQELDNTYLLPVTERPKGHTKSRRSLPFAIAGNDNNSPVINHKNSCLFQKYHRMP
jgi:hypothetical protein